MSTEAESRLRRSRARLTLRWGSLLKRWSHARRTAWGISASWSTERLLDHIATLRAGQIWRPLSAAEAELQRLDQWLCWQTGCDDGEWRDSRSIPSLEALGVSEISQRIQRELPGVKTARVRYLLARDTRRGLLERKARGHYVFADRRDRWYMEEDHSRIRRREALTEKRWEDRFARAREQQMDVLLAHYLLPHLRTYRKLRTLETSERAYYYRLGAALESLEYLY